jgi:hypothetical protein
MAIVFGEVREILFEEGNKHGRRAGLQKKWIREQVVGAGFGGRADDGLQVFGRIGDSGDDGRTTYADAQSRVGEDAHGLDAKIGPGGAGLENSG